MEPPFDSNDVDDVEFQQIYNPNSEREVLMADTVTRDNAGSAGVGRMCTELEFANRFTTSVLVALLNQ